MAGRRSLDACNPFAVWASPGTADHSECDHGIWVDTRVEVGDLERGAMTLSLRAVERDDETTAIPTGDAVCVVCALDSGRCTPADDTAAAFLAERPWFEIELCGQLEILQDRAARAAEQRDRTTAARLALARTRPGDMISYQALFPADWDLLVTHDGRDYWVVDHYCSNPACECADVDVAVYCVRDEESAPLRPPLVGHGRADISKRRPTIDASTPIAAEVFETLWHQHQATLRGRRAASRGANADYAALRAQLTAPTAGSRVPRNAPCPCGSGKKFKRCCLGTRASDPSVDLPRS